MPLVSLDIGDRVCNEYIADAYVLQNNATICAAVLGMVPTV